MLKRLSAHRQGNAAYEMETLRPITESQEWFQKADHLSTLLAHE